VSEHENPKPGPGALLDRRKFLQHSAALALCGVALLPGCGAEEAPAPPRAALPTGEPPRVRRRSTLGRSGIEVPDISFGGWGLEDERIVRRAFERGVTHFDTAPDYSDGKSEEAIGRALAVDRSRVTIATKYMVPATATQAEIMGALEGSLRRLGTDYVDVYFNHAVNDLARIRNPEWLEFVARAKQQGKIRAAGMSGHGGNLAKCVDAAIDDGATDVFLLAHNYANEESFRVWALRLRDRITGNADFVAYQPELPRLIERARAANLGVMVMKTLRGAVHASLGIDPKQELHRFMQAAFRWVLANPGIHGLVTTMYNQQIIDVILQASGSGPPTLADAEALLRYEARHARTLCQPACSACASACPLGVDVAGTLRTRMYAERYGRPEIAKREYAALGAPASACLSCADPVCAAACPAQIDLPRRTRETHRLLG
jgi:predicted aldo/keto reductase-like oxidoreductase